MVIIAGCSDKKTELPTGLLTHGEMVRVLIDIHLLEAKVQKLYLPRDSAEMVFKYFETRLLQQSNVTDSVYNASMAFYTQEIDQLKKIYDEVVDSLLSRQASKDIRLSVDSTGRFEVKIIFDSLNQEFDALQKEIDSLILWSDSTLLNDSSKFSNDSLPPRD